MAETTAGGAPKKRKSPATEKPAAKKSATAGNQNSHTLTLVIFAKAEKVITPHTACKRPKLVVLSVSHNFCYPHKHPG